MDIIEAIIKTERQFSQGLENLVSDIEVGNVLHSPDLGSQGGLFN